MRWIGARVGWPFRILRRAFGLTNVRYRGLKKNHEWLCGGFALANLYQNRKRLAKINLRMAALGVQCARRRPGEASGGHNKHQHCPQLRGTTAQTAR